MSSNGQHEPSWLDNYIEYADAKSPMTPREFHEAIGLWLISTTIARRMVARMSHDDVYPNLWVIIVAKSTLFAKTTAFNLGRKVARRAVPHLLLPDTSTPEAMLEILSGKNLEGLSKDQAAQKGLIVDEASGMMAQTGRDYMAGALELFMRLYDCQDSYERVTRGQGKVTISGVYFPMLAASTPAMLAPYVKSSRMWSNGWWPRFGIVMQPDVRLPYRQSIGGLGPQEDALVERLEKLHRRLPMPTHPKVPECKSVVISKQAFEAYAAFDKAMRYDAITNDLQDDLSSAHGRSPAQALKIAICLAAMDWREDQNAPVVEVRHWERAEAIAVRWLEGAKKALMMAELNEADKEVESVRRVVVSTNDWICLRDVSRATRLKASQVERAFIELEATEEIEVRDIKHGPRQTKEARKLFVTSQ